MTENENLTPRRVPLTLQLRAYFGGASQLWWYAFGFMTLFSWGFGTDAYIASVLGLSGRILGRTSAVVADTGRLRDQSSARNGKTAYGVHYYYYVDGEGFWGSSVLDHPYYGKEIEIEYVLWSPSKAGLAGTGEWNPGPGTLAPLILMAGVIWGLGSTVRKGAIRCRLLASGLLTEGRVTSEHYVRRGKHGYTRHLTFEFRAADRQPYETVVEAGRKTLEDEKREAILYDPNDPSIAVVLGDIGGNPRLDPSGKLIVSNAWSAPLLMILPTAVVVANIYALSLRVEAFV